MLNLIIKTYDEQKNLLKTEESRVTPDELFTMFHTYSYTGINFYKGEYFKTYYINDTLLLAISISCLIQELNFHSIVNQPQLVNYLLNTDKRFSKFLNIINKLETNNTSQDVSFDNFAVLEFDNGEFEKERYHHTKYDKAIFDRSISNTHIVLCRCPEYGSSCAYYDYRPFCNLSYCLFYLRLVINNDEYPGCVGIGYYKNESDYLKRFYEYLWKLTTI